MSKTSTYSFYPTFAEKDNLFSVNEGIDIVTALENASCFLSIARCDCADNEAFCAAYMIDFAKALIDSVIEGV